VPKVLILGLGNILFRDEGLGVRALELLSQTYQLPPEVEVCDGDCLGLELLPRLEGVHERVELPLTHTTLLFSRRTARAVCTFLRQGSFSTERGCTH